MTGKDFKLGFGAVLHTGFSEHFFSSFHLEVMSCQLLGQFMDPGVLLSGFLMKTPT